MNHKQLCLVCLAKGFPCDFQDTAAEGNNAAGLYLCLLFISQCFVAVFTWCLHALMCAGTVQLWQWAWHVQVQA